MPRSSHRYSPPAYSNDRYTPVSHPSSPPSRPSPRSIVSDPPKLHVRETLSAEAATRLMLEKWDILDQQAREEGGKDNDLYHRSRTKNRSSSVPSSAIRPEPHRRMSRVREYELWKKEGEAIRLAQVRMEEQLDREKEEHQLAEAERWIQDVKWSDDEGFASEKRQKKVTSRKATPRFVVSAPASGDEDEDEADWRSTGRRSATTSMASTGSPPPKLDDLAYFNSQRPPPGKPSSLPSAEISEEEGAGQDLLAGAAKAAEQVGEAVTSALSRVLPSLFSSTTSGK
ncbi:hypothetical protein JCM11251_007846 [Rhodosporidiobolus azoricus]